MYNKRKQQQRLLSDLTEELNQYPWSKSPTFEMQTRASNTLLKIKKAFSTIEPDKKYSCSCMGHIGYLNYLVKIKIYLQKDDYWNCCHELIDLFEFEPITQKRVIYGIRELLKGVECLKENTSSHQI